MGWSKPGFAEHASGRYRAVAAHKLAPKRDSCTLATSPRLPRPCWAETAWPTLTRGKLGQKSSAIADPSSEIATGAVGGDVRWAALVSATISEPDTEVAAQLRTRRPLYG